MTKSRVKPLEWEPSIAGKPWHSAKAPWGWYYAQWDEETQAWFASLELGEIEAPIILSPSDVPTIDEAKAAAQADYEARILSALDPTPDPAVQALVEAARVLRDDFGSYKFNSMGPFYCTSKDPQFRQFDEALAKVDAIRAADPVTKSS